LADLLRTFDKMQTYGIPLYANKLYHAEDGVGLLTAHGSKGLEFEYVFLLGAESSQWEKKRSMGALISLPFALQPPDDEEKEKEERRLFYVAVTRAKKQLMVSFAESDEKGKPLEASRFVSELETAQGYVQSSSPTVSEAIMTNYLVQQLTTPKLPLLPFIDRDQVKALLQEYRLSVTHLNKFLRCPLSFYFENVLKIPEARTAASGFGSAIHKALEEYYKAMQANQENAFEGVDALLHYFNNAMRVYKSHFTEDTFAGYVERGSYALSAFHASVVLPGSKVVLSEYRSDHLSVEEVPVSGMLDKLEFNGNEVTVIDYKTGRFREEKLLPPGEKSPNGGDYWRQMVFYKLLLDADKYRNWNMTGGRFDFVEPDTDGAILQKPVELIPDHLAIVRGQIKDTYHKIMNLEFENGCGDPDCRWCAFASSHYGILPLVQEEIED
jgi:DNA helicase-2/ATP-dependent DNA helicase PcrA